MSNDHGSRRYYCLVSGTCSIFAIREGTRRNRFARIQYARSNVRHARSVSRNSKTVPGIRETGTRRATGRKYRCNRTRKMKTKPTRRGRFKCPRPSVNVVRFHSSIERTHASHRCTAESRILSETLFYLANIPVVSIRMKCVYAIS